MAEDREPERLAREAVLDWLDANPALLTNSEINALVRRVSALLRSYGGRRERRALEWVLLGDDVTRDAIRARLKELDK